MPVLRSDAPITITWSELNTLIDKHKDYTKRRYECAKWYCKQRLNIVPFRQGKYKGLPKGITFNTVATEQDIEQWWHPKKGKYLEFDIGMPMGGVAGYCAIDLDVDEEENKHGIDTLAELIGNAGRWEDEEVNIDTWMATTPRGGRHLVFKYHPQIGVSAKQSGARFDDIDTRGSSKENPLKNGGFIFVAPTIKLDSHGKTIGTYEWQTDDNTVIDIPKALVDILLGIPATKLEMPAAFEKGGRDSGIYDYLLRCAAAGYNEDELRSLVPEILERMIPSEPSMVEKNVKSVLNSNVFGRAKKERVAKEFIGGLDLKMNKEGKILKTHENLDTILRSGFFDAEMSIYYDSFLDDFTISGDSDQRGRDIAMPVQLWLSKYFHLEWGGDVIRQHIIEACKFNPARPHTNALRDYILNCVREEGYSAIDALGTLMGFSGHKMEAIYRRYLTLWLCGAVARGLQPGTKFDYTLILIGEQGIGKSMLLHELAPNADWFCDSLTSEVASSKGNKDDLLKLQGSWVMEMAELTPLKNSHGNSGDAALKGFLTAQVDKYRAPYERAVADHPRTCVFAGTSNSEELYRDASGSRRYLTINLGGHQIDWTLVASMRDHLWAEARDLYNELGSDALWLNQDERAVQALVNKRSYRSTVLGDAIAEWAEGRTRFKTGDIIGAGGTHALIGEYKPFEIEREAKERLRHEGYLYLKTTYVDIKGGRKKGCMVWVDKQHWWELLSRDEKSNREGGMPFHGYAQKEEY